VKEYYEARAAEYDELWLGTGIRAYRDRPGWNEDRDALIAAVAGLSPAKTVDVACGTGFLSQHLRGELVLLDQSSSMLEIANGRVPHARAVRADVPPLPFADKTFERLFTSFFYGHLEEPERHEFLAEARRVAGELLVVDAAPREGAPRDEWQERVLNDGSRWSVYKRYFSSEQLAAELGYGEVLLSNARFLMVRA
jgi:demethylmenaquinone methyltransferase/2-methoxy-6-polyprenyl-1,4-benzoquinol methylase